MLSWRTCWTSTALSTLWPCSGPVMTPLWPYYDPSLTLLWSRYDPSLTPLWPLSDPVMNPFWSLSHSASDPVLIALSFAACRIVCSFKWKLRRGWWQHVQIRLLTRFSAMVSRLKTSPIDNATAKCISLELSDLYWFRALQPPGWQQEWHCGVRATKSKKLLGFISAVPSHMHIYDK